MSILVASWLAAIVATVWLITVGGIRFLAHRSGTDDTPGMRRVAVMALCLGAVAALVAVVLSIVLVAGR